MRKTIKFEMPDREPNRESGDQDSEFQIDVDSQAEQDSLFRSRWNELSESRKPKPLWKTPTGMRLLMLCVLLVGVIWGMFKAGNPDSWNWLFQLDPDFQQNQKSNEPQPGEPGGGAANVILADSADKDSTRDEGADENNSNETADGEVSFVTTGPHRIIEVDFWKSYLKSLNGKQQIRFFWLLDSISNQKKLPTGETSAINPVLRKLVNRRQRFHQSLNESGNQDGTFESNWREKFLPVLKAAVVDQTPSDAVKQPPFQQMMEYIREAADSLVTDKSPIERPVEAFAWYAAWSDVFDSPLDQQSKKKVTVTQLLSQPDSYRGDWVEIRGTVLRMNEVSTSNNPLGIERYYVMWIKPDHPSTFPYCLYSLMAPEAMIEQADANRDVVEVPIRAAARFFKNRIFPSDQPAFAPVLMTASVAAIPQTDDSAADSNFQWPSRSTAFLMLGIICGFAVLIAWSVFRSTLGSAARSLPKSDFLSDNFSQLQDDERVETTREKLLRMSEHDQGLHYRSPDPDAKPESSSESESVEDAE